LSSERLDSSAHQDATISSGRSWIELFFVLVVIGSAVAAIVVGIVDGSSFWMLGAIYLLWGGTLLLGWFRIGFDGLYRKVAAPSLLLLAFAGLGLAYGNVLAAVGLVAAAALVAVVGSRLAGRSTDRRS
jgi:hypothetical protein